MALSPLFIDMLCFVYFYKPEHSRQTTILYFKYAVIHACVRGLSMVVKYYLMFFYSTMVPLGLV